MNGGQPEILYGVQLLDDLHNYFPDILYNNSRFTSVQSILGYITSSTRRRFDLFTYGSEQYNSQRGAPVNEVASDDSSSTASAASAASTATATSAVSTVSPTQATPTQATPTQATPTQATPDQTNNSNVNTRITIQNPAAINTSRIITLAMLDPMMVSSSRFGTMLPSYWTANTTVNTYEDDLDTSLRLLNTLADLFPSTRLNARSYASVAGGGMTSAAMRGFMDPVIVSPTAAQIQAASILSVVDASGEESCAICQDNIVVGDNVRRITHCTHGFHQTCIDTWFGRNVRCPVCRYDIRDGVTATTPSVQANLPQ